jgi:flagellar protein FliO/FliZ
MLNRACALIFLSVCFLSQTAWAQSTSQENGSGQQEQIVDKASENNDNQALSQEQAQAINQLSEQSVVPTVGSRVAGNMDAATMIVSLIFVLLLIVILAWLVKRFNLSPLNQGSVIKVVASHHLGSKEKIMIVEVNNEQLVLGVTSQQINLLKTLQSPVKDQQGATNLTKQGSNSLGLADILKIKR